MSTTFGVPGCRQLLRCCVTFSTAPSAATATVAGTKVHESTVMRRFTGSKAEGCAGSMVDAAAGRAASAKVAAASMLRFIPGGSVLDVWEAPLFSFVAHAASLLFVPRNAHSVHIPRILHKGDGPLFRMAR